MNERTLSDILYDIGRNLPLYPVTFGPCERCGIEAGRGSGPCMVCLRAELAALAGAKLADAYIRRAEQLRETQMSLYEAARQAGSTRSGKS